MKILRLIAEVELNEKEAKYLTKTGKIVWDLETPIASICDKPVKFKSATLVDKCSTQIS